ncbi:hypothetical protein NQ318_007576 [Aromia moschata]|uniref:Uncharacterized protein n=1 Tax=Aromia moschata TaxID=1265417 RepID=A0AAV8YC49_9CUCU|nr:hypothetical protein NQ318_007576 [Aromia moschata]
MTSEEVLDSRLKENWSDTRLRCKEGEGRPIRDPISHYLHKAWTSRRIGRMGNVWYRYEYTRRLNSPAPPGGAACSSYLLLYIIKCDEAVFVARRGENAPTCWTKGFIRGSRSDPPGREAGRSVVGLSFAGFRGGRRPPYKRFFRFSGGVPPAGFERRSDGLEWKLRKFFRRRRPEILFFPPGLPSDKRQRRQLSTARFPK